MPPIANASITRLAARSPDCRSRSRTCCTSKAGRRRAGSKSWRGRIADHTATTVERLRRRRHDPARQDAHGRVRVRRLGTQRADGRAVESVGHANASRRRRLVERLGGRRRGRTRVRPRSVPTRADRFAFPLRSAGSRVSSPRTGCVSLYGAVPLSPTLDSVGPLAHTVDDVALLTAAIAGPDSRDPTTLAAPRVDFAAALAGAPGRPRACASRRLRPSSFPPSTSPRRRPRLRRRDRRAAGPGRGRSTASGSRSISTRRWCRNGRIIAAEAYRYHRAYIEDERLDIDPWVRKRVLGGKAISAGEYDDEIAEQHRAIAWFAEWMRGRDALLTPTLPITATPLGEVDESTTPLATWTRAANYLGACALSLPAGFSARRTADRRAIDRRGFHRGDARADRARVPAGDRLAPEAPASCSTIALMNDAARTQPAGSAAQSGEPGETAAGWGSDAIADLLRALAFPYIALTPGASFRGLHDSLVNYLGNTRPELLLCVHEESAVALAHGYARVTGQPLPVALHANVGLMHATMAIFNAWCDRIPILLLGGVGPIDAVKRRPWVDWIHTSRDLGALVRGYTKWDDQPGSVAAALEAIVRADRIATTQPQGPVYVSLDAALQEEALSDAGPAARARPLSRRFARGAAGRRSARSRRAAEGGTQTASDDRPGLVGPRRFRASRRARRALRRARADRHQDGRELSDAPSTSSVSALALRDRRREPADPRRRRDRELRLDRPRRHARPGLRRRAAARQGRPMLARSVRAQRLEHGLSGGCRRPTSQSSRRPTRWSRRCSLRSMRIPRNASSPGSPRPAEEASADRESGGAANASTQSTAAGCMPLDDLARVATETLAPHRPSYMRLPLGMAGKVLPLRASAGLHRLRRRRRHRLGSGNGGRRRARAARPRFRSASRRGARRRRLPDGRRPRSGPASTIACRC